MLRLDSWLYEEVYAYPSDFLLDSNLVYSLPFVLWDVRGCVRYYRRHGAEDIAALIRSWLATGPVRNDDPRGFCLTAGGERRAEYGGLCCMATPVSRHPPMNVHEELSD